MASPGTRILIASLACPTSTILSVDEDVPISSSRGINHLFVCTSCRLRMRWSATYNYSGTFTSFSRLFMFAASRSDSEEESVCRGNVSCLTAVSKIALRPTPRDDGARFACEAEHPAVIGGAAPNGRMRVAVVLSVQCE